MQRFNSFKMIHKGLRAMLYDAALTLQQTDFSDTTQAESALEKIESALYLFEQHAHHEDKNVLPAIAVYEPQIVEDFEKEHIKDIELGDRLKHLLNIFRDTDLDEGRVIAGSAITKSFLDFMVFNLEHMGKEEIQINQALWKHYTDEQLVVMNQQLVASIPAAERALSAKWILRGVNNGEAIAWLKGIQETAPEMVFESLWNIVEAELPESRRENILEAVLGPGIAV